MFWLRILPSRFSLLSQGLSSSRLNFDNDKGDFDGIGSGAYVTTVVSIVHWIAGILIDFWQYEHHAFLRASDLAAGMNELMGYVNGKVAAGVCAA